MSDDTFQKLQSYIFLYASINILVDRLANMTDISIEALTALQQGDYSRVRSLLWLVERDLSVIAPLYNNSETL